MANHENLISKAHSLPREAQANGDHTISAMIVIDGAIVLECMNTVNTFEDTTRHPQLDILRMVAKKAFKPDMERETIYSNSKK